MSKYKPVAHVEANIKVQLECQGCANPVDSGNFCDACAAELLAETGLIVGLAEPKPTPSTPAELKKFDVYEVYGSCATSRGWDFLVCPTMKEALEHIEDSLDSLEDGEEVKIVFNRYTQAQMDEVIYE